MVNPICAKKKKAFVENRDQYRGVFSFCSIGVLLAALTGCFAFIWYRFYSDFLLLPFYRRGNWVMILLYAVLVLLFGKAFGGLKVGYLKRSDSFYSQMLSLFCVNLVTYLQVSLISRHFARLLPFVILMGIDLIILLLWIFFSATSFIFRFTRQGGLSLSMATVQPQSWC